MQAFSVNSADITCVDNPRYGKRTTASGLQLTLGNSAGIMSAYLYKTNEAPQFIRGHAVSLSMAGVGAVIYTFMSIHFFSRNKARQAGKEESVTAGKSEEEVAEMGDENPRFVFTY